MYVWSLVSIPVPVRPVPSELETREAARIEYFICVSLKSVDNIYNQKYKRSLKIIVYISFLYFVFN